MGAAPCPSRPWGCSGPSAAAHFPHRGVLAVSLPVAGGPGPGPLAGFARLAETVADFVHARDEIRLFEETRGTCP